MGGFTGDPDATNQFVQGNVKEWGQILLLLSEAAKMYPQATVALSKYLLFESSCLHRDSNFILHLFKGFFTLELIPFILQALFVEKYIILLFSVGHYLG